MNNFKMHKAWKLFFLTFLILSSIDYLFANELSKKTVHIEGSSKSYTEIQDAIDNAINGDTILIENGTYHAGIRINKNITLKNANGSNDVVISGEKALNQWQYDTTKQLYYTSSPCSDVQMLFINGEEQKASRFPKEEKKYFSVRKSIIPNKKFALKDFNIHNDKYIKGAIAHVRWNQWSVSSRRVKYFDDGYIDLESKIKFYKKEDKEENGIYPDGYKIFFTQVLGAIDDNGEWAWNNNKIYLKSKETPKNVTVACAEYGIYLDKNAKNIEISGLNITKIDGHGITKKNDTRKAKTDNLIIKNNTISYVTNRAISVRDFYKKDLRLPAKTIIENNTIHHARTGGIFVFADNVSVKNNFIHDIGASEYNDDVLSKGDDYMLNGIYVKNSSGARISNNRLNNIGYNGISISNAWAGYLSNDDRIIENNYISNAVLALNDGACIYTHTNKVDLIKNRKHIERDIIRNNIVENCMGSHIGTIHLNHRAGEGIYLDDLSSYTNVYGNTVIKATKSLYFHNLSEVEAHDNTFLLPYSVNILINQTGAGSNKDRKNIFIKNNLLLSADKFTYQVLYRKEKKYLTLADNNIIRVDENSEVKIKNNYSQKPNISLEMWKENGFDRHSKIIKDSSEPIILINPSLEEKTFTKLNDCRKFDNTALNSSNATLKPYASLVLFGCSNYAPATYKESK
jgi:hypothetical protein